jgi:hypothetical protein
MVLMKTPRIIPKTAPGASKSSAQTKSNRKEKIAGHAYAFKHPKARRISSVLHPGQYRVTSFPCSMGSPQNTTKSPNQTHCPVDRKSMMLLFFFLAHSLGIKNTMQAEDLNKGRERKKRRKQSSMVLDFIFLHEPPSLFIYKDGLTSLFVDRKLGRK